MKSNDNVSSRKASMPSTTPYTRQDKFDVVLSLKHLIVFLTAHSNSLVLMDDFVDDLSPRTS